MEKEQEKVKRPRGRPRLNKTHGPSLTVYFKDDAHREKVRDRGKKLGMGIREYVESLIK